MNYNLKLEPILPAQRIHLVYSQKVQKFPFEYFDVNFCPEIQLILSHQRKIFRYLLHFPFLQIAKVASYLKKVRQEIVPHLEFFSVEAMNNSAPIIRPLWMLDPHDPINQVIDDEFLIGDKVNIIRVLLQID